MLFSIIPKHLTRTRPVELVREYIQDCLYNPNYGYFCKMVSILDGASGAGGIDFPSLKNERAFQVKLAELYGYEKHVSYTEENKFHNKWHTASELFWPYYGHGIGKWIFERVGGALAFEKVRILEIGAGNGSLCSSILDYAKKNHPKHFESMEYHLVEVSDQLHQKQLSNLSGEAKAKCTFHNKSIFDYQPNTLSKNEHWFILGMEVLDNLPHDKIMYCPKDGQLLQCEVHTNERAKYGQLDYQEVFVPLKDRLILETARVLDAIGHKSPSLKGSIWDLFYQDLGKGNFGVNPWRTEFIPTMAFQLLRQLVQTFPRHTMLFGDFSWLPERIPGHNAPLVQSCLRGETLAVERYLLQRGYFDIMFQTDFGLVEKMHFYLAGKRRGKVHNHADLMRKYAPIDKTRLQNGSNPMVEEYLNMKYFEGTTEAL